MKRTLIFLLLGPIMVVTAWLIFIVAIGGSRGSVDFVATGLFVFTFFVAAISRPIDGYLARAWPIHLRAPLTAVVGATIAAVGIPFVLFAISPFIFLAILSSTPLWTVVLLATGGALCMGACSLLSHDYGNRRRPAGRAPDYAGRPA